MATLEQRHQRRQDKIKEVRDATKIPMVKVLPRDDAVRKFIAHMPGNIKFPAEGPAKWPFDTFTKRRIRDGDVTLVEEQPEPAPAAAASIEEEPKRQGGNA